MIQKTLLKELDRRGVFRIRPGLDAIRRVLKVLGNPQDQIPCIHVAGTNGKGSVSASLADVLQEAGYSVGLYTSPHLIDVCERIQVNRIPIKRGFGSIYQNVVLAEKKAKTRLTHFEFLTAMAFCVFAREGVDVAVIECGLGGLWDATNVIASPLLSIITSIGLDHMQWLGKTEAEIAAQKAGIIKRGRPVISGVRGPEWHVISKAARKNRARLYQVDRDFGVQPLVTLWRKRKQMLRFRMKDGLSHEYIVGLMGAHQADNAALVLCAVQCLNAMGQSISTEAVRHGLENVYWPGRMQMVSLPSKAPVLLDGAHNPPAMNRLLDTLAQSPYQKVHKTVVFSAYRDKDTKTLGKLVGRFAETIYLCRLPGKRAASPSQLSAGFDHAGQRVIHCQSPRDALHRAILSTPEKGLVIVTGSLALIGTALQDLGSQRFRERLTRHV